MMMRSALYKNNALSWILIVVIELAHYRGEHANHHTSDGVTFFVYYIIRNIHLQKA